MSEAAEKSLEVMNKFRSKFIFFVSVLFVLFASGLVLFIFIEKNSFSQSIVKTIETFIFIIHAKEGISRNLEIILALFGVILIWWTIWSIFDLFLEGSVSAYLKTSKFSSRLKKMRKHYIIAGGGRVGEEIARNLIKDKKPYIIIEKDEAKVSKLRKKGFDTILGDVTDSDSSDLIKAGIKKARVIILAMPETEKNLLVTMTAKELNPDIEVYARADNPAFATKLKKAGAKVVIVPEIAAAEKFLKEID